MSTAEEDGEDEYIYAHESDSDESEEEEVENFITPKKRRHTASSRQPPQKKTRTSGRVKSTKGSKSHQEIDGILLETLPPHIPPPDYPPHPHLEFRIEKGTCHIYGIVSAPGKRPTTLVFPWSPDAFFDDACNACRSDSIPCVKVSGTKATSCRRCKKMKKCCIRSSDVYPPPNISSEQRQSTCELQWSTPVGPWHFGAPTSHSGYAVVKSNEHYAMGMLSLPTTSRPFHTCPSFYPTEPATPMHPISQTAPPAPSQSTSNSFYAPATSYSSTWFSYVPQGEYYPPAPSVSGPSSAFYCCPSPVYDNPSPLNDPTASPTTVPACAAPPSPPHPSYASSPTSSAEHTPEPVDPPHPPRHDPPATADVEIQHQKPTIKEHLASTPHPISCQDALQLGYQAVDELCEKVRGPVTQYVRKLMRIKDLTNDRGIVRDDNDDGRAHQTGTGFGSKGRVVEKRLTEGR